MVMPLPSAPLVVVSLNAIVPALSPPTSSNAPTVWVLSVRSLLSISVTRYAQVAPVVSCM
jgi:hypothetical protein